MINFRTKLDNIVDKNDSLLCIGLDPEIEKLPHHLKKEKDAIFQFNKHIIDETHDLICAYKPNIAFYEAEGIKGLEQLKLTFEYLQTNYPSVPTILDAKRADIGNTAKMYAKSAYEYWEADAITVFPHLGHDSLIPFLEYKDKLTIVLIKTSNPDSGMFQNLEISGSYYYLKVAEEIKKWNTDNLGIFVGATYREEMMQLRKIFPESIFLSAGIGAQNAKVEEIVKAGVDKNGAGIMFNASRSIIYASRGEDFAKKARVAASKLREEINIRRTSL